MSIWKIKNLSQSFNLNRLLIAFRNSYILQMLLKRLREVRCHKNNTRLFNNYIFCVQVSIKLADELSHFFDNLQASEPRHLMVQKQKTYWSHSFLVQYQFILIEICLVSVLQHTRYCIQGFFPVEVVFAFA